MSARRTAVLAATVLLLSSASVVDASASSAFRPPAPRPTMIAAGSFHTVAVTPSGTVRAWGANQFGQLGDGSTDPVSTPVSVLGFSGAGPLGHVVQVAAGDESSYALRSDGTVVAWGDNTSGELGNATTSAPPTRPVRVVSTSGTGVLTGVVAIAAGARFALALLSNHTVVAWGDGSDGELGDGSSSSSSVPVVVHEFDGPVLTGIVSIAAGGSAAYAVSSRGTVDAWGYNGCGALGDNTFLDEPTAVAVVGVGDVGTLSHVVSVSGGGLWAMALLSNGSVVSWGYNAYGELGIGTTSDSSAPVPVSTLGDHIATIGTGDMGSSGFAVASSGTVFGWGYNDDGQVGDGSTTTRESPVPVAVLRAGSGTAQVTAGVGFSAAVTGSGATYLWGDNASRELGNGSTRDSTTPTRPHALGKIGLPKLFLRKAPVLSGHAKVGSRVRVTAGTWGLPATSHGYQWLRDGKVIRNATKATYKLVAADRKHHVSVRVSAFRPGYPGNSTTTRSVLIGR